MRAFAGNGNIAEPKSKGVERRPDFANSTARPRCVGDTFGSRRFCEISPRICARRAGCALGPHSSCAQSAGSLVVVVTLRGDTRQLCVEDSAARIGNGLRRFPRPGNLEVHDPDSGHPRRMCQNFPTRQQHFHCPWEGSDSGVLHDVFLEPIGRVGRTELR